MEKPKISGAVIAEAGIGIKEMEHGRAYDAVEKQRLLSGGKGS